MSFDLDTLDACYTTILCDLWGVVHDGFHLFPGAAERLARWSGEGRCVILITNAPRTATTVRDHLDQLGLPRSAYRGISTGGQAGIDALFDRPPAGFIGTRIDRQQMEQAGLQFVDRDFADLCCIGLEEDRSAIEDYREEFAHLAERDVQFHCLNPDRIVIHGGVEEICAGALGDLYASLGGRVEWYGKPLPAIYTHALGLAGNPPRDTVLAVGDGLVTDVLGAARQGIDCLFVSGGIHAGQPFPVDFAARHDLGNWAPIGVVDGLS